MNKLFFTLFVAAVIAAGCGSPKQSDSNASTVQTASMASVISADTISVGSVDKSEAEWKEELTPQQYHILREEGTERPYSSDLLKIKKAGVYYCAACGLPLYSSETKFESGTGWPSFYKPIDPKVVNEVEDNSMGMMRIEIECAQCGSHIGHVFNDGPQPTGLRYCMNGAAMTFKAK